MNRHLTLNRWSALTAAAMLVIAGGVAGLGCDRARGASTPLNGGSFVGGWGITDAAMVPGAAAAGVGVAFLYGTPPEPTGPLGSALTQAGLTVVSAEVSDRVAAYECHRTFTVAIQPEDSATERYCAEDTDYGEDQLYTDVTAIVERDRSNPLIAGYWVLDDSPDWDPGGLRGTLDRLAGILPEDKPAICGFSAGLGAHGRFFWDSARAHNFSARTCDMVAPYIYSDSHDESAAPLAGVDWSMAALLSRIKGDLRQDGWNPEEQPLVGIAQAFGGKRARNGAITDVPTAADMTAQARGYCDGGAAGIAWFAWSIATNYPSARTPANDSELADGVRDATAVCPRW
jgi:hypothetical protein